MTLFSNVWTRVSFRCGVKFWLKLSYDTPHKIQCSKLKYNNQHKNIFIHKHLMNILQKWHTFHITRYISLYIWYMYSDESMKANAYIFFTVKFALHISINNLHWSNDIRDFVLHSEKLAPTIFYFRFSFVISALFRLHISVDRNLP